MAMIHLRGGRVSLVIDTDDGVPQVLWFGADLGDIDETTVRAALGRPVTIHHKYTKHRCRCSLSPPEALRGILACAASAIDWIGLPDSNLTPTNSGSTASRARVVIL